MAAGFRYTPSTPSCWFRLFLAAFYMHRFALELPFMDQWECVPAVRHMQEGHLLWSDINRQQNEARITVPVAGVCSARATGYNVLAEVYLSYGCLVVSLGALYGFFLRLRKTVALPPIAFLPVACLLFSWRANETLVAGNAVVNRSG